MEKYFETLEAPAKTRYEEKTSIVGDPYKVHESEWQNDINFFPNLTYPDLVNYLVFHPSPFYKLKDFENYRSLEAYDRFVCGWMRDVVAKRGEKLTVIKAKGLHSQSMNAPSLIPWIIFEAGGKIQSAHCDC